VTKLEFEKGLDFFKAKIANYHKLLCCLVDVFKQNLKPHPLIKATITVEALAFAIIGVPLLLLQVTFKTPQPYTPMLVIGAIKL